MNPASDGLYVPAAAMLATGMCSAPCLLALVPEGECDCRCRGRFHAALTAVPVPVDPRWQPPRPDVAELDAGVLGDVLAVLDAASVDDMHSGLLCAALHARHPDRYPAGWQPSDLARALLEVGLRTRQLNRRDDADPARRFNRKGVRRVDVAAALRRARRRTG